MMNRPTFLLCAGLLCGAALLGFGCGPAPAPTPPPTTTTTTLAPTPDPLCFAPVPGPAGDYVPAVWRAPEHLETLIALRDAVGGCSPADPFGKLLNTQLRLQRDYHLCVGIHEGEALLIQESDGLYGQYYAVTMPTGCFATRDRMFKGVLAWIGAAE